jgi:hypothetical protein
MEVKLAGFGILSLFLIMVVPVYAEVTEFSIEKNFYTIYEQITFVGTEDGEGREVINVLMMDPNGKESMFLSALSNSDGKFETVSKDVDSVFPIIGTYEFTAFTIQKENGKNIFLEFDGSKVLEPRKYVLQLNSIESKIIEVDKTITFTASINDNSITNVVYSLENAPKNARIDSTNGKFVWTPLMHFDHGSYQEDIIYNFDIIVNVEDKEDRENVSITVKKVYDKPVIEAVPDAVADARADAAADARADAAADAAAEVVDKLKSQVAALTSQLDAISKEKIASDYDELFDESKVGICGDGTKLINGVCTIIQKIIEKPWWQFW